MTTCLSVCLSSPSCSVGTRRLGNDFTGQITYSYKRRLQLKSVWQPQHYGYALLVRAGWRTRWLQTSRCVLTAKVIARERCNLPRGCSALQLHLTSSHRLPANLSGTSYNTGRKQKKCQAYRLNAVPAPRETVTKATDTFARIPVHFWSRATTQPYISQCAQSKASSPQNKNPQTYTTT